MPYCQNDLCDFGVATQVVVDDGGEYLALCEVCFWAYSLGNGAGDFAAYPMRAFLEELPHMEDEEDWPEWAEEALAREEEL